MFKSKYSNFLTIILIVAIVFVIVLVSILAVNAYKRYKNDKDAENAISRFENNIGQNNDTNNSGQNLIEQNVTNDTTGGDTSGEVTRQVTYYNNFVMIGYIEIPKINIKYPILEKETVPSLEQSVAVRYPDNPKLNKPGNVVIAGHNYRNGQFFSNLKNVATGDIIKITDANGQTLVYTVYEKYETTPEDVAYITRDIGDNTEITLVTCTDDSSARIIVKARV